MATYNGQNFASGVPTAGPVGFAAKLTVLASGPVNVTTAITGADVGTLLTAPAGFTVLYTLIESTDMDTGGPTLTLNVGDAGSATRLVSASAVAGNGTSALVVTNSGLGYQYTADTPVTWAVQAGPTTGATGVFSVWIVGYYTALVA
jgi:hypothetical protein